MRVLGVRKNPQSVKYVDRIYGIEEMGKVFRESDYVINLLPMTEETQKIIDKRYFRSMKKTACLHRSATSRTWALSRTKVV